MPYRIIFLSTLFLGILPPSLADEHADHGHGADHAAAAEPPSASRAPTHTAAEAGNAAALTDTHPSVTNDIRIVIDTSGSMKQTDPKNLRIPALKLLVNLLPAGSRAGVWVFDTQAQELVPLEAVDTRWKTQAEQAAGRINSKGQFTHIEAALIAATQDWTDAIPAGSQRNVILLTDGRVDISRKAEESAASRERIFAEVLPRLQQAGARVFSIALSAQSDQDLLRQIALSTGGWNETTETAEQLQRSFVQMFNKSTPHDSVPLKDNQFHVDASIQEFTVLVMLSPLAKPTHLLAPDHTEISHNTAAENVHWLHETSYDLITVSHPVAGDWKLVADTDPANQVLVVTNLQMQAKTIPHYITVDEKPEIAAFFTEDGQPIQREEFLSLMTLKLELSDHSGTKELLMSRQASRPELFSADTPNLAPGDYNLVIRADGRTFQREAQLSFKVLESLLKVEVAPDPPGLLITLSPDLNVIAEDTLKLGATLNDPGHDSQVLSPEHHGHAWQIKLPAPKPDEHWLVNFQATAKTLNGHDLVIPLKPLRLEPASAHPEDSSAPSHSVPPPNWPMTGAIAGVINLLVFLIGWLLHRMMKKRSDATIAQLLQRLAN